MLNSVRLFFLLMGISFFAHSQALRVRVCDAQGQTPVAYALLTAINRTVGWNTDSLGYFEAPAKLPSTLDSIRVSAPGYQPEIVDVRQGKDFKVSLQRNKADMNKGYNKRLAKKVTLGVKRIIEDGSFGGAMDPGNECGTIIYNNINNKARIVYISYYVLSKGIYNTPFRVRVYKNEGDKPGQEITNDNIIARAYAKNAWNTFDVSRYNLYIPKEGCFVAMEWLNWGDPKYQYQMNDNIQESGYGQFIGLSTEFTSPQSYIRENSGEWKTWESQWNLDNQSNLSLPLIYAPMINIKILYE